MAEQFPDEALELKQRQWPQGATVPAATLYVGLLLAHQNYLTGSQVGSSNITLASLMEPTSLGGSYARQPIAAASWAGPTRVGSGVRVIGPTVSFLETATAYSPTHGVVGFFLTDSPTVGLGVATDSSSAQGKKVVIGLSNFDSGAPIVANQGGIIIRVVPFWQENP